MPPVMFSVITKYHKGRHSLFLYNSEIFYAFTQDILRSRDLVNYVNEKGKKLGIIMCGNQCSGSNGDKCHNG
ncbi:hypothetical protein DTJ06_09265 [Parasaccharibacter sp. TMW 2.1886]|nr:hypothetical protein [Parasaccharibacter sp. TMW 2.1886]